MFVSCMVWQVATTHWIMYLFSLFSRMSNATSVISKIMERVISRKITEYLISNSLLSDAQHGFLKGHSTCTNLLECMNDWTLNIDLGCNT